MGRRILSYCLLILIATAVKGQGSAGSSGTIEPRWLIDLPTAGMIPHRSATLDVDYFQNGGLLFTVSGGLFNRVLIGASFGGTNMIGVDPPVWNKHVGLTARIRLMEESLMLPALSIGYDSQGKEQFIDSLDRYAVKSMGLYAVGSKNYKMLGYFSIHGGVNYSFERADSNENLNLFFGVEKTIGPFFSIVGEYNVARNDQNYQSLGRGRGYINLGARISLGDGFTVGLNLKDITKNQQEISIGNRTIRMEYLRYW